ncbi:MAG TPA: choice-of-anchor tandem repeat GloVer-containing protein [Candidatus Sulfotelmatobacter sp.]|nr:choice-of-anchor tandem repeat GloVer-containing protein [Candidatus Sulfotelmatobacter sp.]
MCFRTFTLKNAFLLMIMTVALGPLSSAQTESNIFLYNKLTDFWPQGGLIEDGAGNLYGTTRGGGTYGVGTVYELSPPAVSGATWNQTILYSFVPYGGGGFVPISDLVKDKNGALYGTFYFGGDPTCNCGGVYKLTPPAVTGGAWTESAIYNFKTSDGHLPTTGALALTPNGTLYGTTLQGGTWDSGVLYKLATKDGITYSESVLYSFGNLSDASTPNGPIVLDSKGFLYGVTSLGGVFNQGTVYKYVPAANGNPAVESVLFSFGGSKSSGSTPVGDLVFDASGNLYGVTTYGGSANDGLVYELSPGNSTWTETVLYVFSKSSGANPLGGLTWNPTNNNLYGTTSALNGQASGGGTVFKLIPPAVSGGAWTESTLFNFIYETSGGGPTGGIRRDTKTGSLYGTCLQGAIGHNDWYWGTAWQIANP